ncbi:Pyruvate [Durusdinium trenchii]|uniref:Phosphate dikinase n=1 Tax=Durusdinium trenchii TaxID=1381693 RepID=A0ABP0PFN2_9DINO
MLLNSTLRLGYLEGSKLNDDPKLQSTLKLEERRPSTRGSTSNKSPAQTRRRNSKERSLSQDPSRRRLEDRDRPSLSREGSKSKENWQSLEWTHVPQKEVQRDGPVVYSVSTPAATGPRIHQPHLVRTTRIEPNAAYSKKRPPIPPKKEQREQITVTEKDLLRCGSDLKKLRECQIIQQEMPERTLPAPLPPPPPLDLSFKSKFAQDCREGADTRDPWKDLKHPDEDRVLTVEDLVLNQASSADLARRTYADGEGQRPLKRSELQGHSSKEVQLYQREAGSRLEAAFRSGRSSVPLAGLQPELDGAIVARLWKSVRGYEMSIEVVGPPQGEKHWRFARGGDLTEERRDGRESNMRGIRGA